MVWSWVLWASRGNPFPTRPLCFTGRFYLLYFLFAAQIYKSTKCNDMRQTGYCPRGPFCAFAHVESKCATPDCPRAWSGRGAGSTPHAFQGHFRPPPRPETSLPCGRPCGSLGADTNSGWPSWGGRPVPAGLARLSTGGTVAAVPCRAGRVASPGPPPRSGDPWTPGRPARSSVCSQQSLMACHLPLLTESLGTANGWGCPTPARSSVASSGQPVHVSGRRPGEGAEGAVWFCEWLGTRMGVVSG